MTAQVQFITLLQLKKNVGGKKKDEGFYPQYHIYLTICLHVINSKLQKLSSDSSLLKQWG